MGKESSRKISRIIVFNAEFIYQILSEKFHALDQFLGMQTDTTPSQGILLEVIPRL
jgi:hypothetical protein